MPMPAMAAIKLNHAHLRGVNWWVCNSGDEGAFVPGKHSSFDSLLEVNACVFK
jgi:hypothetical protein